MNKKKCLTLAVFLFSLLTTTAEVLVVEEKSGDKQYYDLGDKPVITYSGIKMQVNSSKADAEFNIPEVEKYYFLKEVTASQLVKEGDKPIAWVTENGLSFRNGKANQDVQVYNAIGQVIGTYKTDTQGSLDIDLSQYGKGVVLVKTNKTTLKIAR
ncbi:MAG: hypothetical protein MJZ02_06410 [Paludibacteraceae bacterium]|nr:hypothetical protein [Paludibacteraceae bacterium]